MSKGEAEQTKKDEIIDLILADKYDAAKTALSALDGGVVDEEGNTLYHEAVTRQDLPLLRWLLYNYQSTIPPYTPNKTGSTCFHIACANGKTPCFMALWTESKVLPRVWCKNADSDGHTGLHMACLGGHHDVAREIVSSLKEGVVSQMNTKEQTALHIAAAGGHLSCVRLLVQYKALINAKDSFGATALHYAVTGSHMATAKYLIERRKAVITGETKNKMNLVHAAVSSGNFDLVKYIMGKTKERMHVMATATDATVLHIAASLGYESILEYLLVKPYLYQFVNKSEVNGWTAAHLAALRNRAGCLAILIGYGADIHTPRDKNRMSAYHIMCNNESTDMRQTFPHLFDQLDLVRGHRRAQARHKEPRSRTLGSSAERYNTSNRSAERKGRVSQKEGTARREPSLSASHIMKTRMDFTKTNPLAYDSTPALQQRRFQKNKMALPNNGYVSKLSNTSYELGRGSDSDDDFHIADIEQIPETPLRTIQQFNGFRHSAYTPTQSTEDLTNTGVSSSDVAKPVLAAEKSTSQLTGSSLPVILDYSKENQNENVTIYFHNGSLNTVKVKTTLTDFLSSSGSSATLSGHSSLEDAEVEVHRETEPDSVNSDKSFSPFIESSANEWLGKSRRSSSSDYDGSLPTPPPPIADDESPRLILEPSKSSSFAITTGSNSASLNQSHSLANNGTSRTLPPSTTSVGKSSEIVLSTIQSQPLPPPPPGSHNEAGVVVVTTRYKGADVTESYSTTNNGAPHTPPLTAPYLERNSPVEQALTDNQPSQLTGSLGEGGLTVTKYYNGADVIEPHPTSNSGTPNAPPSITPDVDRTSPVPQPPVNDQSSTLAGNIDVSITRYYSGADVIDPPISTTSVIAAASSWPDPPPYTVSDTNADYTSAKNNLIRELKQQNVLRAEDEETVQPSDSEKALERIPFPDPTGSSISSDLNQRSVESAYETFDNIKPATNFTPEMFTYQTVADVDGDVSSDTSRAAPVISTSAESPSLDRGKSPDEIEREYLIFAEGELNNNAEDTSSMSSQGQPEKVVTGATPEPDYAVIVKKTDQSKADTNGLVRRRSSNFSDTSDVNLELKSSTAYKFNYRAYKKKMSAKQDTVTDLFEYQPVT